MNPPKKRMPWFRDPKVAPKLLKLSLEAIQSVTESQLNIKDGGALSFQNQGPTTSLNSKALKIGTWKHLAMQVKVMTSR